MGKSIRSETQRIFEEKKNIKITKAAGRNTKAYKDKYLKWLESEVHTLNNFQMFPCHDYITDVTAETKKKAATMKLAVPKELAEDIMNGMVRPGGSKTKGLALIWNAEDWDKSLTK